MALVDGETLHRSSSRQALLAVAARSARAPDRQRRARRPAPVKSRPRRKGERDVQRVMLKSKIHRATVTDSDLHYVGSITIHPDLPEAADILDTSSSCRGRRQRARFETYTIPGRRGSARSASTAPRPGSSTTATRSWSVIAVAIQPARICRMPGPRRTRSRERDVLSPRLQNEQRWLRSSNSDAPEGKLCEGGDLASKRATNDRGVFMFLQLPVPGSRWSSNGPARPTPLRRE